MFCALLPAWQVPEGDTVIIFVRKGTSCSYIHISWRRTPFHSSLSLALFMDVYFIGTIQINNELKLSDPRIVLLTREGTDFQIETTGTEVSSVFILGGQPLLDSQGQVSLPPHLVHMYESPQFNDCLYKRVYVSCFWIRTSRSRPKARWWWTPDKSSGPAASPTLETFPILSTLGDSRLCCF